MNNHQTRVLEIIDQIMAESEMDPTETFNFALDIGKFCIESAIANLAYQIRKNPSDTFYMVTVIQDISHWIENGIKKGNEIYDQELN